MAARAKSLNESTATLAENATVGAAQVGEAIHEGGKKLGAQLPDSIAKPAEPVPQEQKGDLRKMAESNWQQITVAAQGIAQAATAVAGAVSDNAHRAIEHNFGKEADKVAQGEFLITPVITSNSVDLGQSGANVGSTVLSAGVATSAAVQGGSAGSGAASSGSGH